MSSQSMYGDIINLSPDSLQVYIFLTQSMIPGKFHWPLFITDNKGVATRYQWKVNHNRSNWADPVEIYSVGIESVTELTPGNHIELALIKLHAFMTPTTDFDYNAALSGIFPAGYSTIKANRDNKLNCKTWLLAALQILRQYKLIGLSESQIIGLEVKIISAGLEAETLLGMQGYFFKTPVIEL